MRKLLSITLLVLLSNQILAGEITDNIPSGALTMPKAREIALADNPGIAESLERINMAREALREADSALLPELNLNARGSAMRVTEQPDWQPDYRMKESLNQWTAGLQMNWLLFDGFARQANILAAKQGIEQAQDISSNVRRLLAQAVSISFLQAQLARENMIVAAQSRKFNLELEQNAKIRYEAGTAPEVEMLNFSLRALQAESDYINSEKGYKTACTVLAELMAIENAELAPEMLPESFDHTAITPPAYDYNTELAYALEHRPDLSALQAEINAVGQQVKARQGSFYPQVSVYAGLNYTKTEDVKYIDQDENNQQVGLSLSWNLFSGNRREALVAQFRHKQLALEQARSGKLNEIQSQLQQSINNLYAAYEVVMRQEKALDLTIRIRNHVQQAYQAGTINITRVNEAQSDLVAASVETNAARIQYLITKISIQSQAGRLF